MKTINKIQELHLKLIEAASFNDFDGSLIVKDLRDNDLLWESAVMKRQVYGDKHEDLIDLRDLGDDCWNVDTLYVYTDADSLEAMLEIAKRWKADEVEVMPDKEAWSALGCGGAHAKKVIRVWWD